MTPHDVIDWSIADHLAARQRGVPAVEVIGAVLDALDAIDDPAVVIGRPLRESALAGAAQLDRAGRDGEPSALPLTAVPFVVKDNIDVAGVETSAGCPSFAARAVADAVVVARLRAAGAIPVAKVNLDQFATGLVGARSPYGTPRNPIQPDLVPGGSSSGSAVAVARGLVPFSLGTDTAGSGRVPAAMCGIVGLKPTVGRAANTGIVPAVRRIDCPSVFARSIGEARLVADLMAGPDDGDPFSRPPGRRRGPVRRVGVPALLDERVEDAAAKAFTDAVAVLKGVVDVVTVDIGPLLAAGNLLYGGALVAERAVALAAFLDGQPPDADPTVASIIAGGARFGALDAYRAEYELAAARRSWAPRWTQVDAILLPTTPGVSTLAAVAADPIGVNSWLGTFTTFANLMDLAAVAFPLGERPDGRPSGVQLLGPAWSDDALADLAAELVGEASSGLVQARCRPGEQSLVVVGAHLSGMPLNHQLTGLGGRLLGATRTAPAYRLHHLRDTAPPKPGLVRVAQGGASIEVEVWALPTEAVGSFLAQVPPPLAIGSVELADGGWRHGFVCEPLALDGSPDVTAFGGWRAYLEQRAAGGEPR